MLVTKVSISSEDAFQILIYKILRKLELLELKFVRGGRDPYFLITAKENSKNVMLYTSRSSLKGY